MIGFGPGCTESDLYLVNTPPLAQMAQVEVPFATIRMSLSLWPAPYGTKNSPSLNSVPGGKVTKKASLVMSYPMLRDSYTATSLAKAFHEVGLVALDPQGDTGSDTVLVIVDEVPTLHLSVRLAPTLHAEFARMETWRCGARPPISMWVQNGCTPAGRQCRRLALGRLTKSHRRDRLDHLRSQRGSPHHLTHRDR